MYYVYLIKSLHDPVQTYVGYTTNLETRLKQHNEGASVYTAKYRPWRLVTYIAFTSEENAKSFEAYLKSGSGNTFARKRLW